MSLRDELEKIVPAEYFQDRDDLESVCQENINTIKSEIEEIKKRIVAWQELLVAKKEDLKCLQQALKNNK